MEKFKVDAPGPAPGTALVLDAPSESSQTEAKGRFPSPARGPAVWFCLFSGRLPWYSVVKNPPAKQEIRVQSRAQEDPLKEGMATHSSVLA